MVQQNDRQHARHNLEQQPEPPTHPSDAPGEPANPPAENVNRQQTDRQQIDREEAVLLNTTPGWLNWAAVTLAVLIVAGIFILSARQLNAPQPGVSANQMNGIQAGVGGMQLDANGDTNPETATEADVTRAADEADGGQNGRQSNAVLLADLEPGYVLMNPAQRVELYADANADSSFLDSYARGGTFVVMEPTGDYGDYPIVIDEEQWVRVRAADGLVGWTPVAALEAAP